MQPLAHRLGVYKIKQELEDLCLRYLDPEGYQNLIVKVGMKRAEREENIRTVIDMLSDKLKEMNIHYEIDGRPKHFYSIYRKMVLQHKPFEQIFDLFAIRVSGRYRTGLLCCVGRGAYALETGAKSL